MRIVATFRFAGQVISIDEESGFISWADRWRLPLLKNRQDKDGKVFQLRLLNGDRLRTERLIETASPTLAGLLDAVEIDETQLREPNAPPSNVRVIHHRDRTEQIEIRRLV